MLGVCNFQLTTLSSDCLIKRRDCTPIRGTLDPGLLKETVDEEWTGVVAREPAGSRSSQNTDWPKTKGRTGAKESGRVTPVHPESSILAEVATAGLRCPGLGRDLTFAIPWGSKGDPLEESGQNYYTCQSHCLHTNIVKKGNVYNE